VTTTHPLEGGRAIMEELNSKEPIEVFELNNRTLLSP
jgi:hypothetical protein